jgi:hypothetical protein
MHTEVRSRFEVFTVVKIQVDVFRFVKTSETLVSHNKTTRRHKTEDNLKKLIGKYEGKRPFGRPRLSWEVKVK